MIHQRLEELFIIACDQKRVDEIPTFEDFSKLMEEYPVKSWLADDDYYPNMLKTFEHVDEHHTTMYELRLSFKHLIRRILTISKANNFQVSVDLSA